MKWITLVVKVPPVKGWEILGSSEQSVCWKQEKCIRTRDTLSRTKLWRLSKMEGLIGYVASTRSSPRKDNSASVTGSMVFFYASREWKMHNNCLLVDFNILGQVKHIVWPMQVIFNLSNDKEYLKLLNEGTSCRRRKCRTDFPERWVQYRKWFVPRDMFVFVKTCL